MEIRLGRATMQIYGPAHVHGPQPINAPHALRAAQSAPPASRSDSDQLQISAAGQLASQFSEIPEIRQDRVDALRAAIAEGNYDTTERLSAALDNLLDEIG
jgi:flagellar biosynthesis anti-sigma factor FlgM